MKEKAYCVKSENFSAPSSSPFGTKIHGKSKDNTICPLIPLAPKNLKGSYLFKMISICSDFIALGVGVGGIVNG